MLDCSIWKAVLLILVQHPLVDVLWCNTVMTKKSAALQCSNFYLFERQWSEGQKQTGYGDSGKCRLRSGSQLLEHLLYNIQLPACTFLSCVTLINRFHVFANNTGYFLWSLKTSAMLRLWQDVNCVVFYSAIFINGHNHNIGPVHQQNGQVHTGKTLVDNKREI